MGNDHSKELAELERQNGELRHQLELQAQRSAELVANSGKQAGELEKMQGLMASLQQELENMRREAARNEELLKVPIRDRENRVSFVNNLKLGIKQTDAIVLVGQKGKGKSTFLYLMGEGPKPQKSFTDGTVGTIASLEFCDTIGIHGWELHNLAKLLVLLIYRGVPKDIIVFTGDRIMHPIVSLAEVGIVSPMLVSMHSTAWMMINVGAVHLEEDRSQTGKPVLRVKPESDLNKLYAIDDYAAFNEMAVCKPITHHDNVGELLHKRDSLGVRPFAQILQILGSPFEVNADQQLNDSRKELVFRFIYIYEKRYKNLPINGELQFMNNAKLEEFGQL